MRAIRTRAVLGALARSLLRTAFARCAFLADAPARARLTVVGLLGVLALAVSSCGLSAAVPRDAGPPPGPRLVVGISFNQPGLAQRTGAGTYSGVDIDISRFVARALGVDPRNLTFTEVRQADRESALRQRKVDLVVNNFSITDERKATIDFAGPYFIAGQSLLTRRSNTDIAGPESLDYSDWKLCSVTGTTSAELIKRRFANSVTVTEFPSEPECMRALENREVDAVTGDDVVLAGYAAQQPDKYRLAGETFSVERYGIGLHKGDSRQPAVTAALRAMIADGEWSRIMQRNLGSSRYLIPPPPVVADRP